MNLLSDEILNKYIDGELNASQIEEIKAALEKSEDDRKRFNVLKVVHDKLSLIQEDEISEDFTNIVMAKISKPFTVPRRQKYFIVSITSIFILVCLGIVGYVASIIISSSTPQTESIQMTETVQKISNGLITELRKLFSGSGLSIVGSVLSLAILISGYFFFERQKQTKANLGS